MRGIYLDCSEAPYKSEHFFRLFKLMKNRGYDFFLLNLGQFFPWSEDFHFRTFFTYPEDLIQKISIKSQEMGISLIPVLEADKRSSFIVREPYYRFMVPGFPEDSKIDLGTAGCSKLFEDMIDDLFSLFTESDYIYIKTVNGIGGDEVDFFNNLISTASLSGKKVIHPCTDMLSGGGCINENSGKIWTLKIATYSEINIERVEQEGGFIPFCAWLNIDADRKVSGCLEEYSLKKDFDDKIGIFLRLYYELMSQISLILLNSTMGSVCTVIDKYRILEESACSAKRTADKCISVFSEDFADGYIPSYYSAAMEPVEILLAEAGIEVARLKKRL